MGIEFEDRKEMPDGTIRIEGVTTGLGWNGDGVEKGYMDMEWKVKNPFVEGNAGEKDSALLELHDVAENTAVQGFIMRRSDVEDMFMGTQRGADSFYAALKGSGYMEGVMRRRNWSSFRIASLGSSAKKCRIAGSGGKFGLAQIIGKKIGKKEAG